MLKTVCGRLLLATLSLTIGLALFHVQVADALIVRGDDQLVQNAYTGAAQHYRRALWFDPGSGIAVDRIIFVALERRTPETLRSAVELASRYLRSRPEETEVLSDRALCYLRLKKYADAYRDFFRAARLTADPQQYTFAGWAARRSGRLHQAAAMWRRALTIRHGYRPAVVALAELKR